MRTTMNLDQTVYQVLKELAQRNQESMGKTASRLIKEAVQSQRATAFPDDDFPFLPEAENAATVTSADIEHIRESLGI